MVARISVAGDDERAVDGPCPQEAVGHLNRREDPTRTVGDVEGEGARLVAVRVLGMGSDVLLDERGQSRLAEVAVAVDADVDEQSDVVRAAAPEAGPGRVVSQQAGAVPAAEPSPRDR